MTEEMTVSSFDAVVADVKNGKTKLVIKLDAETIDREQLANLNDLISQNVEVSVRAKHVVVHSDSDSDGQDYSVNVRGEVDLSGQTNIDDYISKDPASENDESETSGEESDKSKEPAEDLDEELNFA